MYCKKCKVEILNTSNKCPLCDEIICETEELDSPNYPKRNSKFRFPLKYSFARIFLSVTFSVYLVAFILNLIFAKDIKIANVILISLLYAFVLIRHTIISPDGSAGKIFMQGFMLALFAYVLQRLIKNSIIYDYVIPIILMGNCVSLWTAAIIRRIRYANYALYLVLAGLFSFVPLIFYAVGLAKFEWVCVASSIVGGITIIFVLSIFSRFLIHELRRILHL